MFLERRRKSWTWSSGSHTGPMANPTCVPMEGSPYYCWPLSCGIRAIFTFASLQSFWSFIRNVDIHGVCAGCNSHSCAMSVAWTKVRELPAPNHAAFYYYCSGVACWPLSFPAVTIKWRTWWMTRCLVSIRSKQSTCSRDILLFPM